MKQKQRRRCKNKGFITVFVTLIMVPVVAFTGTMVDVARLKFYSSQAAMAADSYGEVVLGEYDNLLKELYGLFSVTQNEAGKQAIMDMAKYTGYSFIPNGDDKGLEGFMPYKDAEIEITSNSVPDATLDNNNVLMTQIGDFMKYRVVEELLDESGILSCFDGLEAMSQDMDAVATRNEITDSSAEALGMIDEYYQVLKIINDYSKPESGVKGYIEILKENYEGYANALKTVVESDDYEKYVYYINPENKQTIDDAKEKVEDYDAAKADYDRKVENGENTEGINLPEEPSQTDRDNAAKYVDVAVYKEGLNSTFVLYEKSRLEVTGKAIKFGEFGSLNNGTGKISELDKIAKDLQSVLTILDQQIDKLEGELEGCSDSLRTGIEAEIEELKDISEMTDDFQNTVTAMHNNDNTGKDIANQQTWNDSISELQGIQGAIIDGTQATECTWETTISFQWYDFKTERQTFYNQLKELCETGGENSETGDKDIADKNIKAAEKKAEEYQKKIDEDAGREARNFTTGLANQIGESGSTTEVPDLSDCFSGGASLSDIGNAAIGKFLLTTYDFGMFSNRVSGIEEQEDNEAGNAELDEEGENQEYYDESLTGYKMSNDINYMYGAEIEYLIAGYTGDDSAKKNQDFTRNVICGIRMTTNFVSTYTISEINSTINGIANAAATAVAATGIGAAAAPLIRVAVSGALRLTVATIETAEDWNLLMEREEVIFYKSKLDELSLKEIIIGFLDGFEQKDSAGGTSGSGSGNRANLDFALSYEDYLYIMMIFFVDEDTLLDRTSNLITLNVNQAENISGEDLQTLKFKMSKTITAVKSTCEVKLDFVIVPEKFINMFISGSDTEAIMQKLDNGSYGYSVIRGY